MTPLVFARQVAVIDAISGLVLEYISRQDAAAQFVSGSVKIDYIRPGVGVVCVARVISKSASRRIIDAKPGSFGIDREGLDCGAIIFQHKPTFDRVLSAA